MTREEQLDWLCRLRSEIYVYMPKEWLIPMNNALDMAISALEQKLCEWGRMTFDATSGTSVFEFSDGTIKQVKQAELEQCEDAISREAFITRYREWMKSEYGKTPDDDTLAIRVIKSLPPVTQKSGKWIDYSDEGYVECPFCGHATNCEDNIDELHYCFYCGAKMFEPQESEDKG